MKKIILITISTFIVVSSCKILDMKLSCSEFYVKNELSSTVLLKSYKLIDSGYYFSLDSFSIAPNETKLINQDCRYVDSIIPYPKGAYTKLTFANGSTKLDTFNAPGTLYLHDSINIYNKKRWIIEGDNKLRKATYYITLKDSLEAR